MVHNPADGDTITLQSTEPPTMLALLITSPCYRAIRPVRRCAGPTGIGDSAMLGCSTITTSPSVPVPAVPPRGHGPPAIAPGRRSAPRLVDT